MTASTLFAAYSAAALCAWRTADQVDVLAVEAFLAHADIAFVCADQPVQIAALEESLQ